MVVHDGINAFFELQRNEVRNILIVDSSIVGLKLLHRRMLAMFPYAKIGLTTSAEDAMKRIDFVSSTTTGSRMYDLLVVEERLEPREQHVAVHHGFCFNPQDDGSCPIGSQFLRYVEDVEEEVEATKVLDDSDADGDCEDDYFEDNDSQTRHPQDHDRSSQQSSSSSQPQKSSSRRTQSQRSLKIAVSANLGEDCDALRRGGADLFWPRPLPKSSDRLRNQVMNALLSKRERGIFVLRS